MKRNRIRICGRKTSTLPTPAISPSCTKLRTRPSAPSCGSSPPTAAPNAWKPPSIRSIGACAQANTAWNIRNSTVSRIASPATGCSSTASSRRVSASRRSGACTAAARMRSASFCSRRMPVASGADQEASGTSGISPRRSIAASSAAVPPRRTATAVTTGRPSSAASRSVSISRPRCRAISNMLSTSRIGRPVSLSSSTSRRPSRRLVASATQTIRSGAATPAWLPSTTSRVTCSSGLRARRE